MFPKKHRYSFKGVLPKQVFNSQSFSLRFGKNEDGLKVAVVVSKRVDKRATVRNRIKRKVLDIRGKKINKNEGLTLVFYMKNRAVESLNLEKEIETVMETIENRA